MGNKFLKSILFGANTLVLCTALVNITTSNYSSINSNCLQVSTTNDTAIDATDVFGPTSKATGTLYYTSDDNSITFTSGNGSCSLKADDKTKLTFPDTIDNQTVTGIGDNAFDSTTTSCEIQSSLTFPTTLTYIGANAFSNTDGSTISIQSYLDFSICKELTMIGANAFANNANLSRIIANDTLTNVGANAFKNDTGISSIMLRGDNPQAFSTWDVNAFNGCTGHLKTIYVPDTYFDSYQNYLVNQDWFISLGLNKYNIVGYVNPDPTPKRTNPVLVIELTLCLGLPALAAIIIGVAYPFVCKEPKKSKKVKLS